MVRTVTSWMTRREDPDGDGLQGARRVAEPARQARGLLLELLRDVVLVVVLAQRVVRADVVDVAGDVVRERLHLVDDRRHHDEADQEDREEEAEEDREDRGGARQLHARGAVDRRAERDGEEDGDQQQPDDRADEVEHVEQDAEGDQREEDPDDGPRAELGRCGHGRRQRIRGRGAERLGRSFPGGWLTLGRRPGSLPGHEPRTPDRGRRARGTALLRDPARPGPRRPHHHRGRGGQRALRPPAALQGGPRRRRPTRASGRAEWYADARRRAAARRAARCACVLARGRSSSPAASACATTTC